MKKFTLLFLLFLAGCSGGGMGNQNVRVQDSPMTAAAPSLVAQPQVTEYEFDLTKIKKVEDLANILNRLFVIRSRKATLPRSFFMKN